MGFGRRDGIPSYGERAGVGRDHIPSPGAKAAIRKAFRGSGLMGFGRRDGIPSYGERAGVGRDHIPSPRSPTERRVLALTPTGLKNIARCDPPGSRFRKKSTSTL